MRNPLKAFAKQIHYSDFFDEFDSLIEKTNVLKLFKQYFNISSLTLLKFYSKYYKILVILGIILLKLLFQLSFFNVPFYSYYLFINYFFKSFLKASNKVFYFKNKVNFIEIYYGNYI